MAKQSGVIPIRGAVGNLQFFKAGDGSFHVRQRTQVEKGRIFSDKRFRRLREHISEFTTAVRGGKLLRQEVAQQVKWLSDTNMTRRLNSALLSVVGADPSNVRGARNLVDGDIRLLKGFEFSSGPVKTTVLADYIPSIDRATGKMKVVIPAFNPDRGIEEPKEATHFQLHAIAVDINFATGVVMRSEASSAAFLVNQPQIPATTLECSVLPGSLNHQLLLFGIEFLVETNGQLYDLKDKSSNGMKVVEASMA